METLGEQTLESQILAHTFPDSAFNIALINAVGEKYDVDPEMYLIVREADHHRSRQ